MSSYWSFQFTFNVVFLKKLIWCPQSYFSLTLKSSVSNNNNLFVLFYNLLKRNAWSLKISCVDTALWSKCTQNNYFPCVVTLPILNTIRIISDHAHSLLWPCSLLFSEFLLQGSDIHCLFQKQCFGLLPYPPCHKHVKFMWLFYQKQETGPSSRVQTTHRSST